MKCQEEILVFLPFILNSLYSGCQESQGTSSLGKPGGLIFWQETYTLSYHISGETEAQKEEITWPALSSYRYFLTLFKLNLIGFWGWYRWRSQQTFVPLPNVSPPTASTGLHRVPSCVAQWECKREVRATFMESRPVGLKLEKKKKIRKEFINLSLCRLFYFLL